MTINQTPIDDELEDFLISINSNNNDNIGYVFASAFKFEEPFMQVSKLQALTLKNYILTHNIKSVLEIGTFVGFSAFAMASAMKSNRCKLASIEIDEAFFKQAILNMNDYKEVNEDIDGIIKKISFINADAKSHIQESSDEYCKYDMIFLDGDKENYGFYIDWFVKNSKVGAHLLIDNILFKGMILGDGKYANGIKKGIDILKSSKDVTFYAIPVGDCMLAVRKNR